MVAQVSRVVPRHADRARTDQRKIRRASSDGKRLNKGDRGPAVEALQRSLRRAGVYDGKIDGVFDKQVKRAVEAFQQARGLRETGRVGPKTQQALRDNQLFVEDGFETAAKRGQRGSDILKAERRLAALGYHTGKVDGKFDKKTARAVKGFRADNPDLENDRGRMDQEVWQNLQQAYQQKVVRPGVESKALSPGEKGRAVRKLENKLDALGYDVGKKDNVYNAGTAAAVAKFQRRHDMKVTGRANAKTVDAIEKEARRPAPHKSRRDWFISQFRGKYNTNEDTYSDNGNCGPTSVTMIASAFGKVDIKGHRADAAIERSRRRFGESRNEQAGTTFRGARRALESYGIDTKVDQRAPNRQTLKRLKKELAKGKLVLANVVPKYFSESLNNGHFTVVTAIKNGRVYLSDPGTNRGPMSVSSDEFLRCLRLRHRKDASTFGLISAKG